MPSISFQLGGQMYHGSLQPLKFVCSAFTSFHHHIHTSRLATTVGIDRLWSINVETFYDNKVALADLCILALTVLQILDSTITIIPGLDIGVYQSASEHLDFYPPPPCRARSIQSRFRLILLCQGTPPNPNSWDQNPDPHFKWNTR